MPLRQRSTEQVREFLQLATDRYKLAAQAENDMRQQSLDDVQFSIGDQWPTDIKADRQVAGRPCLTVNVLPQFIRQVTNEQRQNRPAITVNPVGSNSDVDTAEIIQGWTRHVEVRSDAEQSYDTGFDQMVRGGFGYWRLNTSYVDDTKEQDACIEPILNQFCVYCDPTSQMPDHSDKKWAFIVADVLASEFSKDYPHSAYAKGASLDDYISIGDMPAPWAYKSGDIPFIRIAEYYYAEKTDKQNWDVYWSKITALDILDEELTVWCRVPIIGVYGDDITIDGRRHVSGLVRFAKDAQRAKNYWTSAATEMIALAPKAPWVVAAGQTEDFNSMWEQANVRNLSRLVYKPVAIGGTLAPPPSRNTVEPPIQAMNVMLQTASADLNATTGLYPAALGQAEHANEPAKAVLARQQQGRLATLNYSDNLARSIRLTGRLLVKAMRKIKTVPQVQRVIKPDDSVSMVGIYNSANDTEDEALKAINEESIKKAFDIGVGEYDVTVSVGPSYQTRRQEAVATQMELMTADPQLVPIIGDIVTANMDIPGAREISERLKKLLPPALQDMDDPEGQMQALKSQHAQLAQEVQLLSAELQKANQIIQTKQVEQQGKYQIEQMSKQFDTMIAKAKIDAQITVAEIETKAQQTVERMKMLAQTERELHGSAHELGLQKDEQSFEKMQADAERDHQQQMAQTAAQNEQDSQVLGAALQPASSES